MLNAGALKELGGQGEGREKTKSTARYSPNWFPSKQSPTTLLSCFRERLEKAGIHQRLAPLTLQIERVSYCECQLSAETNIRNYVSDNSGRRQCLGE